MRKIIKYIVAAATLAMSFTPAFAQTRDTEHGQDYTNSDYVYAGNAGTRKVVSDIQGEYYTVTLEAFATGSQTVTEKRIPSDIVLVLDVSGSMNEVYNVVTEYTAMPADQGYSVNIISNIETHNGTDNIIGPWYGDYLYYKYGDNYYRIRREGRRMYFTVGNQNYWLRGNNTAPTTSRPDQVNNNNSIIWTGQLFRRKTKLDALKESVIKFTGIIKNDNDNLADADKVGGKGNQIAIVKFSNQDGTSTVSGFTEVTATGQASLDASTNGLSAKGATRADLGMDLAQGLFDGLPAARKGVDADGNPTTHKVLIMFTDGNPTTNSGFEADVANDAIEVAYDLKHLPYLATVYSIGVFPSDVSNNTRRYMFALSSDSMDAKKYTDVPENSTSGGYFKEVSPSMKLDDIFTTIANSSGGAAAGFNTSTEVRDVMAPSFMLPEGLTASQVTVTTETLSSDGMSWTSDGTFSGAQITINEAQKKVSVTGFDFGANWVGQRKVDGSWVWGGKKLVISFPAKADPDGTGGPTETNDPSSGVYVNGVNVSPFEMNFKDLPVTIRIVKNGLDVGETSSFNIYYAEPVKQTNPDTGELEVVYLANGKAKAPEVGSSAWHLLETVAVTNYGDARNAPAPDEDGNTVYKVVAGLNPHYVYLVEESDWSWSKVLTSGTAGTMTSSETMTNPYVFYNSAVSGAASHAEAVSSNHFGTGAYKVNQHTVTTIIPQGQQP